MPGTSEFCEALGRANTRCLVTLVCLRAVSASGHFMTHLSYRLKDLHLLAV